MNARSAGRSSGMVLLEVIIALTIFTGVAFALIMALDAATEAATDRNQIEAATAGLENEMAKVTASPLSEGQRDLPDDGSGITYHLQIAPETLTDDARKSFSGFFRVTLRAKWTFGGKKDSRDLSELIYQK